MGYDQDLVDSSAMDLGIFAKTCTYYSYFTVSTTVGALRIHLSTEELVPYGNVTGGRQQLNHKFTYFQNIADLTRSSCAWERKHNLYRTRSIN